MGVKEIDQIVQNRGDLSADILHSGGGTPAPTVMTACPSSCSLPPPALSQEDIPGWSWPS